jgi:hypothetical protein
MKKMKLFGVVGGVLLASAAFFLTSADHIDAPGVASTTSDIADLYAFEGDNPNNTVLIATVQGPLTPGDVTTNAAFDEDVVIQFNIDNDGDFLEDLVIQAVKRGDSMYVFGPVVPTAVGLTGQIETSGPMRSVRISTSDDVQITTEDGISIFAGPRRDGFFFDFNRFNMVISGAVAPAGFLPPGEASDFFEDLNVLAVSVEVPNAMLGTAPTHVAVAAGLFPEGALPDAYNVWVTTKRKQ